MNSLPELHIVYIHVIFPSDICLSWYLSDSIQNASFHQYQMHNIYCSYVKLIKIDILKKSGQLSYWENDPGLK